MKTYDVFYTTVIRWGVTVEADSEQQAISRALQFDPDDLVDVDPDPSEEVHWPGEGAEALLAPPNAILREEEE